MALTVAAVPTGMKAGVRIMPRGVEIAPVRARPSVAWTVKENSALTGFAGPARVKRQASPYE